MASFACAFRLKTHLYGAVVFASFESGNCGWWKRFARLEGGFHHMVVLPLPSSFYVLRHISRLGGALELTWYSFAIFLELFCLHHSFHEAVPSERLCKFSSSNMMKSGWVSWKQSLHESLTPLRWRVSMFRPSLLVHFFKSSLLLGPHNQSSTWIGLSTWSKEGLACRTPWASCWKTSWDGSGAPYWKLSARYGSDGL